MIEKIIISEEKKSENQLHFLWWRIFTQNKSRFSRPRLLYDIITFDQVHWKTISGEILYLLQRIKDNASLISKNYEEGKR